MLDCVLTKDQKLQIEILTQRFTAYPVEESDTGALVHIANGTGNYSGCIATLAWSCEDRILHAWFFEGDLAKTKYWCAVHAKLRMMPRERDLLAKPKDWKFDPSVGWIVAVEAAYAYIADHPPAINWYAGYDAHYDAFVPSGFKGGRYWSISLCHAMRGEWDILKARSEAWLYGSARTQKKDTRFDKDNRFFLGLATGDQPLMQKSIDEMLTPLVIRNRLVSWSLMVDLTTIMHMKIARYNGFHLVADNPYVPLPWLEIDPLPEYKDPFEFMNKFDYP
jgi:hypothetical protein